MNNIWKTIEVTCWSMGLPYDDYLFYHAKEKETGLTGAPLHAKAYTALCVAFDTQADLDLGEQ